MRQTTAETIAPAGCPKVTQGVWRQRLTKTLRCPADIVAGVTGTDDRHRVGDEAQ
jgi:hypothetical protein